MRHNREMLSVEYVVKIQNGERTSVDVIAKGMIDAFSDYVIAFPDDIAPIKFMMRQRGYEPALSALVKVDNNVGGSWLIARREGEGQAYAVAVGTAPEFRRLGYSRQIFEYLEVELAEKSFRSISLDVISTNDPAVFHYKSQEFKVVRHWDSFAGSLPGRASTTAEVSVLGSEANRLRELTGFGDWEPSVQNSLNSIRNVGRDARLIIAHIKGETVGHCVFIPQNVEIMQIAMRADWRRKGIATSLFAKTATLSPSSKARFTNIPVDERATHQFLLALGWEKTVTKFEMQAEIA